MKNSSLDGSYTPEAWTKEELYGNKFPGLVFYAYTLIGNEEAAKDLVTEVIYKWSKLNLNFATNASAYSYLQTTIRNACFDYLKAEKKRQKIHQEFCALFPDDNERETVAQGVSEAMIKALLASLPLLTPLEGEYLRLRYKLGMKPKDIAPIMNITVKTAHDRGNAIREKLRKLILEKIKNSA